MPNLLLLHLHLPVLRATSLKRESYSKEEDDAEKERQKAERYKVAFALDQQWIGLEKEKFELKRMIE
uniref:Uncharacterized protein n=1 Tax=Oryza sativa subsp. japonica TaxID=39947 RepID=Q8LH88_ORYSJ|nr:hypothetical protein [Oryza sativa Japonica Group]